MNTAVREFRTCIQSTLANAQAIPQFEVLLKTLQELGFYGIELNLPELDSISHQALQALLEQYDLKLHMLATGAYAKGRNLSLSNADPQARQRAIEGACANIDYAAQMGCGIILGFFKGPKEGAENARALLISSLKTLGPYAAEKGVSILLEATNRRETSLANTIADTLSILEEAGQPSVKLLADTYHMAIEEAPVEAGILAYAKELEYLHISDENRHFPGLGSLDFAKIYASLRQVGFSGFLTIEGNILNSEIQDLRESAAYLSRL